MSDNNTQWGSRIGVIFAVAGAAIGIGNFLRFPGLAAANGGGAFLVPYFVSLLLLGIPLCWAEWTMGRLSGSKGFHSAPGAFTVLSKNRWAGFLGVLGLVIPMMVFTYYVVIEAWCLGYAWEYLMGTFNQMKSAEEFSSYFATYSGQTADGSLFGLSTSKLLIFVIFCFSFNFFLIFRGLNKGIEKFCIWALPAMLVCAVFVLVRVLTLGTPNPDLPEQSVASGLNFMWDPDWSLLLKPTTWLAAAGQIFFSLGIGFGIVIVYASYLRKNDDVVLSGLTATSTNEFVEVGLAGMITIPAAFIFLGAGVATQGTFGLGFNTLPNVFAQMPAGNFFGFLWFFMLFLAAITSSISMLQPVHAFFEEGLGLNRQRATIFLLILGLLGSGFILWYSESIPATADTVGKKNAMDSIDFWVGTVLIVILAFSQSILYGWVYGAERGQEEMNRGGLMKAPSCLPFILRYVTPVFLLAIMAGFVYYDLSQYINDLEANPVAQKSIYVILGVIAFFTVAVSIAVRRWAADGRLKEIEQSH